MVPVLWVHSIELFQIADHMSKAKQFQHISCVSRIYQYSLTGTAMVT